MFRIEKAEEIGGYLRRRILEKNRSIREFCRKYIELRDEQAGGCIDDEEIRKLLNRFSQILKGTKRIQIDDLPYVTQLLGISCEEVLSAGKHFIPIPDRVTNYSMAFEKDPAKLQAYIDRKDKLILNYDEYGKSVLDYAYKFRNYRLFQFLIDRGYIIFKDSSDLGFRYNYGAETTIKRREFHSTDILESRIRYQDDLRMNIITLAIENKDYSMLDSLRARETPMLHFTAIYSNSPEAPEHYDCSKLVAGISSAPDEVLDYFSKEYTIQFEGSSLDAFFVFQHLDEVIQTLIGNHDKRAVSLIESAASHNRKVYERIKAIREEAALNVVEQLGCSKQEAYNQVITLSLFHENCNALRFFCASSKSGIASNIIRCDAESSDSKVSAALMNLNSYYDLVKTLLK